MSIEHARRMFVAAGLHTELNEPDCLSIAGKVEIVGDRGIEISQDACVLFCEEGQWQVNFPGKGMLAYEVVGTLDELVPLILSVYADYRRDGGKFGEAFGRVVEDAERYLVGGVPARV